MSDANESGMVLLDTASPEWLNNLRALLTSNQPDYRSFVIGKTSNPRFLYVSPTVVCPSVRNEADEILKQEVSNE